MRIPFDDLYTKTAPKLLTLTSLAEYLVVGTAVGIWLVWRGRNTSRIGAETVLEPLS